MSQQSYAETAQWRAASYRINLLVVPVELRLWRRLTIGGLERWSG